MSQFKLTVTFPDGTETPFDLNLPSVTIGRGIQSTVVVPDDSVAESHVELSLDVSGYLITSLAGEGETLLNGHPLEPGSAYQLESGSVIQIGGVQAVYDAAETMAEAPAEAPAQPVDFPTPGSFDLPKHPPGVFAPVKSKVNFLMIASVVLVAMAVLGALVVGFSATEIRLPR